MDTLKVSEDGIGTTRVLWIDEAGRVNDKWDVYLLDAANEATAWLTARSLDLCANQLNASVCQLGRETTTSELTVGLCMSTRDRLWQLQRALPFNILQTWPHRNWCHIYVVDCGGADGTLEWMKTNCRSAIDVGLLTIYQASHKDFPHWHASVGKNCAADVATEHILVNVDSDSIVGPDFVVDVVDRFSYGSTKGFNMVLHYEGVDCTCGRIACTRKDFMKLEAMMRTPTLWEPTILTSSIASGHCPRSGMNGWAAYPSARPSLTPWMRKFKLATSVTLSTGMEWMLEAVHFLLVDGSDNQTCVISTRKLQESWLKVQIRKISRFP
jgi:hypothetical protein